MSKQTKSANDAGSPPPTVAQHVLEVFYQALAQKPELKEIAERFRAEKNHSEAAIRKVLFGDEA